jgi:hypothetical protein
MKRMSKITTLEEARVKTRAMLSKDMQKDLSEFGLTVDEVGAVAHGVMDSWIRLAEVPNLSAPGMDPNERFTGAVVNGAIEALLIGIVWAHRKELE